MRFRSYVDGARALPQPGDVDGGAGRSCTPTSCSPSTSARRSTSTRDYTARSTERTHRWLDALPALARSTTGPPGQVVYGIVQGGVDEDLRIASTAAVAASGCEGIAIGGSLGRDKAQMHEVVDWTHARARPVAPERPRHLLGIGEIDDLIARRRAGDRHLRLRDADAARPPRRRARPRPRRPLAPGPVKAPLARLTRADARGLPVPGLRGGLSRGYLHYLCARSELTGARLLTLHNLTSSRG